jgi:hypothetical protein
MIWKIFSIAKDNELGTVFLSYSTSRKFYHEFYSIRHVRRNKNTKRKRNMQLTWPFVLLYTVVGRYQVPEPECGAGTGEEDFTEQETEIDFKIPTALLSITELWRSIGWFSVPQV